MSITVITGPPGRAKPRSPQPSLGQAHSVSIWWLISASIGSFRAM